MRSHGEMEANRAEFWAIYVFLSWPVEPERHGEHGRTSGRNTTNYGIYVCNLAFGMCMRSYREIERRAEFRRAGETRYTSRARARRGAAAPTSAAPV